MSLLSRLKKLSDNPAPSQPCSEGESAGGLDTSVRRKEFYRKHDKSVLSTEKAQRRWSPPEMEEPSAEDEFQDDQNLTELGILTTDASLYTIRVKRNGKTESHSALKLPSYISRSDISHSLSPDTFNILMVDVSASMAKVWSAVQCGWNNHVAPQLRGHTVVYTFGTCVTFRRLGNKLDKTDFDAGGTDLTGALQTIINEVYVCKQRFVNIFIVTDGHHNTTDVDPREVIDQMQSPIGKICNVYILGVGNSFPAHYSVDIRSKLHSGSSNVPCLFWAKLQSNIEEEMAKISNTMCDGSSLQFKLGISGSTLPGLVTSNVFHSKEWVYFDCNQTLLKTLSIRFSDQLGTLELEPQEVNIDVLEKIFHQWNSVIIQRNKKKESIPNDIFEFMEGALMCQKESSESAESQSISHRQQKKEIKTRIMGFQMEMKKVKNILTTTKFKNELELAENVLSTTVIKDAHKLKYLKYKGHTDADFEAYRSEFEKVYNKQKGSLQALSVTPDDCCRITMASTISDLQDPDFLKLLYENDKFEFLKEFTITGIPVHAPTRDSVAMNPWTFRVQSTLKSPYTIMSQVAMESFANLKSTQGQDKMVQLKDDDENTCYNAVVPVFPPSVAKAMHAIVRTKLYTMCITFATLKNPHIIDYDIHMASLAVTWVFCLYENPNLPRPGHALLRMESIEATAQLYTDLPRFAKYIKLLLENPSQALMTESIETIEGKSVKCESLIKPMFLLYMYNKYNRAVSTNDVTEIVKLLLMEYIGRCLSSYKSSNGTPFTDFFAESLADQDKKKELVKKFVLDAKASIAGNENMLLENFYTFEKASKAAKIIAKEDLGKKKKELITQIPLKVHVDRIEQLRKISTAGDVSWFTLRVFAKEMGLRDEIINHLFSEESIFVYSAHALLYRASRDRLSKTIINYSSSHAFVFERVQEECSHSVVKIFYNDFVKSLESLWKNAYLSAHKEIVKPMSRQQIISEAQRKGIEVTNETFDQVYKAYQPTIGLLRNACQTRACPYFLQPNNSYNQHAVVERKMGTGYFVHGFHKIAYTYRNDGVANAKHHLENGPEVRTPSTITKKIWKRLAPELKKLQHIYQEMDQGNTPS